MKRPEDDPARGTGDGPDLLAVGITFAVTMAGRLESGANLTSDPQFGRGPSPIWERPWAPKPFGKRIPTAPPAAYPNGHAKNAQQFGPRH